MNLVNLHNTNIIHKNLLHSYTLTTERWGQEIKETMPCTIAAKRIKYLGINIPKETTDSYTENYKIAMKEIKDNKNRWKYTPHS